MHRAIAIFVIALAACLPAASAPIKTTTKVDRQLGAELFVSVGDVMLKVEVRESLPNAFGGADIFGRTREKGFSDLRYMGVDPSSFPIFRRRDVDIVTNETTMNRTGMGTGVINIPPAGTGGTATGIFVRAHPPNVQTLPPDTIEFGLDLTKSRMLTIRDRTVQVVEATGAGIRYVVLGGDDD